MKVELGSNLTTIGDSAFVRNNNLETLTLPESIRNIAYNAFNGCSNLDLKILAKKLMSQLMLLKLLE